MTYQGRLVQGRLVQLTWCLMRLLERGLLWRLWPQVIQRELRRSMRLLRSQCRRVHQWQLHHQRLLDRLVQVKIGARGCSELCRPHWRLNEGRGRLWRWKLRHQLDG